MRYFIVIFVLLFGLVGFIFVNSINSKNPTKLVSEEVVTNEQQQQLGVMSSYSISEVTKHNNSNDCWLAIGGWVYDVTEFISSHPGGNAILEGCGKDATELFETRPTGSGTPHSDRAIDIREQYLIGRFK